MAKIFVCRKCNEFTMGQEHCGQGTETPVPAKILKNDEYGKYRRLFKKGLTK